MFFLFIGMIKHSKVYSEINNVTSKYGLGVLGVQKYCAVREGVVSCFPGYKLGAHEFVQFCPGMAWSKHLGCSNMIVSSSLWKEKVGIALGNPKSMQSIQSHVVTGLGNLPICMWRNWR